ncbi:glycosyltransferase family 2 protein [Nocardia macrotermitis]|uniref:glycosyltransferase family 2 protein n=1 Tax=Nocardia macrotermitis TaxID=2585198 RepID=UPI001D119AEB|nr:hypothetical protein [Nocardia macrotermitis]
MRRNLVIVRATEISQHESWLTGPGDRNWDLIVSFTGSDTKRFRTPHAVRMDFEGSKWDVLREVARASGDTFEQYEYVWLPDDDLQTDTASINRLFEICAEYSLALAQPALTADSYVDHEISRIVPDQVLRYTNYIGPMAPCFGREFLNRCLPEFQGAISEPGLAALWPTMLGEHDIAVVDRASVRNVRSRPIPRPATDEELEQFARLIELEDTDDYDDLPDVNPTIVAYRHYLDAHDLTPIEPRVRGEVAADPDAPPATPPKLDPFWVASDTRERLDPARCVILVPVGDSIEPDCASALFKLEQLGYPVWRLYGASGIDQVRSQMATDALAAGFEELMWIDADMSFPVEAVMQLRTLDLPISCGVYTKKGQRELVVHLEPGTERLTFGEGGGLAKIKYGATGFLHTRRRLYDEIQEHEQLPTCNKHFGRPVVPYFLPMAVPVGEDFWYLGEDFAFCERARRCGYDIIADTKIRLGHIGRRTYGWEDAGSSQERFASFTFNF